MPELRGLPGVKRKVVKAVGVRSRTKAVLVLAGGNAATAAGDNGAITVWTDDDANYRCEFSRFMSVKGSLTTNSLAAVKRWLTKWWPQMEHNQPA